MSQIFHPSINVLARLSLLLVILLLAGFSWLGFYVSSSPFVTEVGVAKAQAVPYSHQLHVGQLGLDCRYCHTSVETSNTASIPPTSTCMGCHAQVATDSPALQLVIKTQTMQMSWCLECHRAPEKQIRPRSEVFTMGWQPPSDQETLGKQLIAEHGIQAGHLTDCSVCHR